MQIKPHPSLNYLIKHYLVLEGNLSCGKVYRLFTDGNTGMVFNLSNSGLHLSDNTFPECESWLYGQVETYHDLSIKGNIQWLIVVLQPYTTYELWKIPAIEWSNQFFPATAILGRRIDNVSNALLNALGLTERIRILNNFFLKEADNILSKNLLMTNAIQFITGHHGNLSINELTKELSLTERTLERKFKQHVGTTPKRFIDIVRVNASAKRIRQNAGEQTLTDIGYECGYFDQAHFIREFKKYTGITPFRYQEESDALALNFLPL